MNAPKSEAPTTAAVPEGVPLQVDDELVRAVDFAKDADGLVPAIVQDATDKTVLTVAYMDAEALRRTLSSGRTWFYSRSRREYWQKGETSGDRQYVREVRVDCDGDALVVLVDQHGRGRVPHRGAHLLLPDDRHGARGARAVTPRGAPGPGALGSAPILPSSPPSPRSMPSCPCGARWSPTP